MDILLQRELVFLSSVYKKCPTLSDSAIFKNNNKKGSHEAQTSLDFKDDLEFMILLFLPLQC